MKARMEKAFSQNKHGAYSYKTSLIFVGYFAKSPFWKWSNTTIPEFVPGDMGCRVAMHSALVPVLLVAGLAAPAAAFVVSVPAQAKGQRPCLPDILSGALTAGAGSLLAPPPHRWRRCPQRAAGARRGRLEMTDAYLHLLPHSSGQTSWLFLPDVFVLVSSELQQKQPIIQGNPTILGYPENLGFAKALIIQGNPAILG